MPSPIDRVRWVAPAILLFVPVVLQAQPRTAEPPLDEVGYAAVMEGTASMAVRGAHRALPMPSYVEVTALDSGYTILVEVVARGAEVPGEAIALSCGAVRQLGLSALPAAVRVRRVSPPDQERDVLSAGQRAAARLDAPAGLLSALRRKLPAAPRSAGKDDCGLPGGAPVAVAPPPPAPVKPVAEAPNPAPAAAPKPAPIVIIPAEKPRPAVQPPKASGPVIQVAALSDRKRAEALARSLGGHVSASGKIFRVRTGPYPSDAAARAALPALRAKGFADARVMPNEKP